MLSFDTKLANLFKCHQENETTVSYDDEFNPLRWFLLNGSKDFFSLLVVLHVPLIDSLENFSE